MMRISSDSRVKRSNHGLGQGQSSLQTQSILSNALRYPVGSISRSLPEQGTHQTVLSTSPQELMYRWQ